MISFSVNGCRSARNAYPAVLGCVFYSTSIRIDRVCPKAQPLAHLIQRIDTNVVLPHLKEKTDWVSKNDQDGHWIAGDLVVLTRIKEMMESDECFSKIKEPFVGLAKCLMVHVNHRTDIISFPENKQWEFPENGELIRAFYNFADSALIHSSITVLKERDIVEGLFTEAYISAELRRLIRKMFRVAGSVQTANESAIVSPMNSACVFPDRDRSVLELFEAYGLAKNVCELTKEARFEDRKSVFNDLESVFTEKFPPFFQPRDQISKELILWAEKNSFGFSFNELVQKYLDSNLSEERALQKIIGKAAETNTVVNSKMPGRPTCVSKEYIDDLRDNSLFNALETQSHPSGVKLKRYKIVSTQSRNFHANSSPQRSLEEILENKILKEPVVWRKYGYFGLTVDLGKGVSAKLFPGHEDNNTSIKITDGKHSVCREIPEYWLENWSVNKEKTNSTESKF